MELLCVSTLSPTTIASPSGFPGRPPTKDNQAPGKLMQPDSRVPLLPRARAAASSWHPSHDHNAAHAQQATLCNIPLSRSSAPQGKTSCWSFPLQAGDRVQSCSSCEQSEYWYSCKAASGINDQHPIKPSCSAWVPQTAGRQTVKQLLCIPFHSGPAAFSESPHSNAMSPGSRAGLQAAHSKSPTRPCDPQTQHTAAVPRHCLGNAHLKQPFTVPSPTSRSPAPSPLKLSC